jgi:predicted RNase H-like HicB family nuclease
VTAEEHLAVPYVLVMESFEGPDGTWLRRAAYPELPGCFVIALSPVEAFDRLEEARVRYILQHLERGEAVSVPRPPLHR